jgi:hypothetical protein
MTEHMIFSTDSIEARGQAGANDMAKAIARMGEAIGAPGLFCSVGDRSHEFKVRSFPIEIYAFWMMCRIMPVSRSLNCFTFSGRAPSSIRASSNNKCTASCLNE